MDPLFMVFMICTTAKSALEIFGNSSPTALTDYSNPPPPSGSTTVPESDPHQFSLD